MALPAWQPPDDGSLGTSLSEVFKTQVFVLEREVNDYSDTSEIVRCRVADRGNLRFLCKYEVAGLVAPGSIAYEAAVYRNVLHALDVGTPYCYGMTKTPAGDCVVLDYLENAELLDDEVIALEHDEVVDLMLDAARWLGDFHRLCEQRFPDPGTLSLRPHDAAYYRHCLEQVARLGLIVDMIPIIAERFEATVATFLDQRRSITHGDFYGHNILVVNNRIRPIDWESAAIDLAEADLVTLLEGWDADDVLACEEAYCQRRWPAGAPDDFLQAVGVARLCHALHNLARPGQVDAAPVAYYELEARDAAATLGIL